MTTTLVDMLEGNAKDRPGKTALVYKDLRYSYQELNGTVNRLANRMDSMGIGQGDRVGLMLSRVPENIFGFLASVKIGAIPAPVNYNLATGEIRTFLASLNPSIIFTAEKFFCQTDEIASNPRVVVINKKEDGPGHIGWNNMLDAPDKNPGKEILPEDPAYLNYTSGSTGNQKGAITTHNHLYWNTRSAVEAFDITGEDIHLCMFAAFAHPHELFARALYTGGTIVLLDEIFPKSLAKTIRKEKVTCLMGLAPMYQLLIDVAKEEDLRSLRLPESGGMYANPNLVKKFQDAFGVPIVTVWGSTETTGIAIANKITGNRIGDSIGKPCPYYEVKVVDEQDSELKPGEVGELIFKGPAVVEGYQSAENVVESCLKGGWYYSGDLARMDEEGYFYFADRKSSMMKVAGLKVFPLEIEEVLKNHSKIKEVAVIRTLDGLKGECPLAVIVPQEGQELSKQEIASFCQGKLAGYKIPKKVVLRNELPKIGSGKINKKVLAREFQ